MMPQWVGHLDEVAYDFPELKVVMRHGAEPDEALAVKLLLKWPNLYYSTSAFAPKYWPEAIVKFANSRGAGKVIYGGYFPMGLELSRIFAEMDAVPFKDAVWPKFLYDNAAKVAKKAHAENTTLKQAAIALGDLGRRAQEVGRRNDVNEGGVLEQHDGLRQQDRQHVTDRLRKKNINVGVQLREPERLAGHILPRRNRTEAGPHDLGVIGRLEQHECYIDG